MTSRSPARLGRRLRLSVVLACTLAAAAHAQVVPGSGELLQQQPHPAPPAPSSSTGLTIKEPEAGRRDTSPPFFVRRIEITGNSLLSTSELHSLVQSSEGKNLNLAYLEELAALVTKRYQDHGYLLSRAYVPAQTLSDGSVRIAVLEARFGETSLSNTSRVSDALLKSFLAPLQTGQPVDQGSLERALLLLSDVPGAVVSSTLAPGAAVGTSNLDVAAVPSPAYGGAVALDNGGNRFTGRTRVNGTLDVDNPLRHGDVFSMNGLTAGPNLSYGRLGYQTLLANGEGTNIGGAVSGLYYHLGGGLSALHAHGTARTESLTVMQPFIRSTTGNLFAQLGFDGKQLRDEVDASGIHTDRRTNALTATLAGDLRDAGGISNMNLGISVGRLDFDNDAAAIADASSAKIRGTYAKVSLSLARLQRLSGSNSVYLAINGQAADKNLDPSEQFFLGGPNSVRAYDVGSVGGAIGALASAEFRHSFAPLPFGVLQATAFIDSGVVQVYENAFDAGDNRASLSGIGMGLDWMGPRGWSATAGLAARIGGVPSLIGGDTASSRLWIELRKGFPGASKNL